MGLGLGLRGPDLGLGFDKNFKLDLAFNNVNPKDWYFVLDYVYYRTKACVTTG